MICLQRTACCCLAALACVALAGCGTGESGVIVTGQVLQGGKPVDIPDYTPEYNCLQVEFYPLDEAGNLASAPSHAAFVAENGSFKVEGPMGEGIPAGKYRVGVRRLSDKEEGEEAAGAVPWAKFEKENSPFVFSVPADKIVIDLAQAGD